jgi:hypothetical protein
MSTCCATCADDPCGASPRRGPMGWTCEGWQPQPDEPPLQPWRVSLDVSEAFGDLNDAITEAETRQDVARLHNAVGMIAATSRYLKGEDDGDESGNSV